MFLAYQLSENRTQPYFGAFSQRGLTTVPRDQTLNLSPKVNFTLQCVLKVRCNSRLEFVNNVKLHVRIYIADNGDCLWLAQNKQCKNSLMKHQRRRNTARRCEINFIPLVYSKSDRKHRQQQLACVQAHHDGRNFAPCHTLRGNAVVPAKNQMQEFVACDPLQKNTKRCETSHGTLADTNSCHAFMICDQAVILSGGWNSWSHAEHHASNTLNFYKMLKKNGFLSSKIKVFYSYGLSALRGIATFFIQSKPQYLGFYWSRRIVAKVLIVYEATIQGAGYRCFGRGR